MPPWSPARTDYRTSHCEQKSDIKTIGKMYFLQIFSFPAINLTRMYILNTSSQCFSEQRAAGLINSVSALFVTYVNAGADVRLVRSGGM